MDLLLAVMVPVYLALSASGKGWALRYTPQSMSKYFQTITFDALATSLHICIVLEASTQALSRISLVTYCM